MSFHMGTFLEWLYLREYATTILKVCTHGSVITENTMNTKRKGEYLLRHTSAVSALTEWYRCPEVASNFPSRSHKKIRVRENPVQAHICIVILIIWFSSGSHCVCFYKSAYNIQMFILQSLGPGLIFAFFFFLWANRVADAFNVPHFTTADQRSPSPGGRNGLGCMESYRIQALVSLQHLKTRQSAPSCTMWGLIKQLATPKDLSSGFSLISCRTHKRCPSVSRTAHMLARPVQRLEGFERSSGHRALRGSDRWHQWRCATITLGSRERKDRLKLS